MCIRSACHQLARKKHRSILSSIITGDEKCCLCANIREKKGMVEPEKEKNMSEMFQFLHLALHFLASTATLTVFK